MKKASKWFGLGGGALSSIVGVLGAIVLVACPCKVVALSAIIVGIFGAGAAVYIQKYSWVFIVLGVALIGWGVFSILTSKKKKCACECEDKNEGRGTGE